jgi:hypothetical protein
MQAVLIRDIMIQQERRHGRRLAHTAHDIFGFRSDIPARSKLSPYFESASSVSISLWRRWFRGSAKESIIERSWRPENWARGLVELRKERRYSLNFFRPSWNASVNIPVLALRYC